MAIGMTHMHLANVPLHVCWRPRDVEALFEAALVYGVDVAHPDRHPHAFVRALIAEGAERHFVGTLTPAALPILAEEDLAVAGTNAAERRGIAPVPPLLPPEPFKPCEALLNVRHVQYGRQSFRVHDSYL